MSKENPGDDPQARSDWKSTKQTDEPWNAPVEKEQNPSSATKPDLEKWQETDTH